LLTQSLNLAPPFISAFAPPLTTGYALMHLLALHLPETFPMATIAPWRKHKPVITAGLFAAWMRQHFFGLAFRHAYDRKSEKFIFPAPRPDPLVQPAPA
jgi:hypothetical protein